MHLPRLTLSWEDGIFMVSSYSVLFLVTWSPYYYLNVAIATDDLIILVLFLYILDYSQIVPE